MLAEERALMTAAITLFVIDLSCAAAPRTPAGSDSPGIFRSQPVVGDGAWMTSSTDG
jgi:hypothetical protein